jgi:hypothetical protein
VSGMKQSILRDAPKLEPAIGRLWGRWRGYREPVRLAGPAGPR